MGEFAATLEGLGGIGTPPVEEDLTILGMRVPAAEVAKLKAMMAAGVADGIDQGAAKVEARYGTMVKGAAVVTIGLLAAILVVLLVKK